MNLDHLKTKVIEPVLTHLGYNSKSAVNLVLGTICAESNAEHLIQLNNGPAKGICQMEPSTRADIYNHFLKYKPVLKGLVTDYIIDGINLDDQMVFNLAYAVAMCRVHYIRVSEALPAHDDVYALARYWKKYYNTELGAGSIDHFVDCFPAQVGYV